MIAIVPRRPDAPAWQRLRWPLPISLRYEQLTQRLRKRLGELIKQINRRVLRLTLQPAEIRAIHACICRQPLLAEHLRYAHPAQIPRGFDGDQRNGEVWKRHRKRLVGTDEGEFGLKLYAVGNTQGRRGPAFLP